MSDERTHPQHQPAKTAPLVSKESVTMLEHEHSEHEQGLPDVTVMCCTYGRFELLRLTLACFLQQEYPGGKQLLILNDAETPITCDQPGVKVFNMPGAFKTLGEKRQYLLQQATTPIVAVFDDDDLYLPWHLHRQVSALLESGAGLVRCRQAYRMDGSPPELTTSGPNSNLYDGSIVFYREEALKFGGFSNTHCFGQKHLMKKFDEAKRSFAVSADYPPMCSYIYRWSHQEHKVGHQSVIGERPNTMELFKTRNKDFGKGQPLIPGDLTPYGAAFNSFVKASTPVKTDEKLPEMKSLPCIFAEKVPGCKQCSTVKCNHPYRASTTVLAPGNQTTLGFCVGKCLDRVVEPLPTDLPLISISMPVYDEPKVRLRQTLSSLAKSLDPTTRIEVIMADDASNPPVDIGWFKDLDLPFPVKIIRADKRIGCGAARNLALTQVSPEAGVRVLTDCHMNWRHRWSIEILAQRALEEDAFCALPTEGYNTDGTLEPDAKPSGFLAGGCTLYVSRTSRSTDLFPYKWRKYQRPPSGWNRVAATAGACYAVNNKVYEKMKSITGELFLTNGGKWGQQEGTLALQCFLLDTPILQCFTHPAGHKYSPPDRNWKEVDIHRELWLNTARATQVLFSPAIWRLRLLPFIRTMLAQELIDSATLPEEKIHRSWTPEREWDVFTHLCGKDAPLTEAHPIHKWIPDVLDAVRRIRPSRILAWRPSEALVRAILEAGEGVIVDVVDLPGARLANFIPTLRVMGVNIIEKPLAQYTEVGKGKYDLVLVGGERQAECIVRATAMCLPGNILVDPTAQHGWLEEYDEMDEEKAAGRLAPAPPTPKGMVRPPASPPPPPRPQPRPPSGPVVAHGAPVTAPVGAETVLVFKPRGGDTSYEASLRAVCRELAARGTPIKVLEWGSGASTCLIHCELPPAHILTIESEPDWAAKARARYGAYAECVEESIKMACHYDCYPLTKRPKDRYDLIFVDGRRRVGCLVTAREVCAKNGIIVLHDAGRLQYAAGLRLFVEGQGWRVSPCMERTVVIHQDDSLYTSP